MPLRTQPKPGTEKVFSKHLVTSSIGDSWISVNLKFYLHGLYLLLFNIIEMKPERM